MEPVSPLQSPFGSPFGSPINSPTGSDIENGNSNTNNAYSSSNGKQHFNSSSGDKTTSYNLATDDDIDADEQRDQIASPRSSESEHSPDRITVRNTANNSSTGATASATASGTDSPSAAPMRGKKHQSYLNVGSSLLCCLSSSMPMQASLSACQQVPVSSCS
jgi:hypothetical protein